MARVVVETVGAVFAALVAPLEDEYTQFVGGPFLLGAPALIGGALLVFLRLGAFRFCFSTLSAVRLEESGVVELG